MQRWSAFQGHLKAAQAGRDFYTHQSQRASEELARYVQGPAAPAEGPANLFHSHYTFDFAQQVTLPVRSRQVGPIYFKTPHRVQVFGVCNEGLPQQIFWVTVRQ